MKNYAYIDKGGILHIVEDKNTAMEYCTTSVIATGIPCEGGYPLHEGKDVTMYGLDLIYLGGNMGSGRKINADKVPEIAELYRALM